MRIPERVYQRAIHFADREEGTGCLISRYSVGSHGYAQIGWNEDGERVVTLCHRVVWIYLNGQIPEGMTIDHTCKQRMCTEIAHLRCISNYENARRTFGRDWPLGECANGHPNSELRQWGDRLRCRLCWNERQRARRTAKKSF